MVPAATRTTTVARRRRRGSEAVAADLLDAALVEFSAHGYDGASTRAIAERARAHQPQINYHFSSKEQLWKAAVDRLFGLLATEVEPAEPVEDPVAAFAEGIRRFVRFSARRPELHRIMSLESTADSGRLDWIVERHIRPQFERLALAWSAVRRAGAGAHLEAIEVYQLMVGFGAQPFANAPVFSRLSGLGPPDDDHVSAHAERVVALLLPPTRKRRR